jgi:spectinomycin phosphotransferase
VRNPPADLGLEWLRDELRAGWSIAVGAMDYVPEGGGSHHWSAVDGGGTRRFVTVDDLDDKAWLGDTRDAAYAGLCSAFSCARMLRDAGLRFVVAPIPAHDGSVVRRIDDRYAASVYRFCAGHSYRFGPYRDETLRGRVMDLVARLHMTTAAVRNHAPRHELGYGGQRDLKDFLSDPDARWDGGPYSEPARLLLATTVADVARLVGRFEELADQTARAREQGVITHGEPHPANLISVRGDLLLVDWDTVALAPPERDLSLVVAEPESSVAHYERMTGHDVNFDVITLYRLRWYLDDLASTVRLFHEPHDTNPDTQRWWEGLEPRIAALPQWLTLLGGGT